eukprot:scaffold672_cov268-Pinguiococcus_pyrenoidosus.AAC.18
MPLQHVVGMPVRSGRRFPRSGDFDFACRLPESLRVGQWRSAAAAPQYTADTDATSETQLRAAHDLAASSRRLVPPPGRRPHFRRYPFAGRAGRSSLW